MGWSSVIIADPQSRVYCSTRSHFLFRVAQINQSSPGTQLTKVNHGCGAIIHEYDTIDMSLGGSFGGARGHDYYREPTLGQLASCVLLVK